jgi:hypothetical protein
VARLQWGWRSAPDRPVAGNEIREVAGGQSTKNLVKYTKVSGFYSFGSHKIMDAACKICSQTFGKLL